jgi:AcrR family transcriptional regulator
MGELDINPSFHNLDSDKQKRIINAACKEFAENGFEKASTNQIVKHAGIGKGMLFYYFKNKEELYHYLIDYCLNHAIQEYFQKIDTSEPDFIERLKQAAQLKTEYHLNNPDMLNFLAALFLKDENEMPERFRKRYKEIVVLKNSKLYDNIDTTLFRNDIDTEKAFKLIRWSIEGYQQELINQLKNQNLTTLNMDPYWDEFYEYLDVLKTIFYKREGMK